MFRRFDRFDGFSAGAPSASTVAMWANLGHTAKDDERLRVAARSGESSSRYPKVK
jgi:hypothetical protein